MWTNMKIKFTIIGCLSFLMVGFSHAQANWNWPEDAQMEAKAREYNAAYTDYRKSGEFLKAREGLHWLLTNVPDLNESLYINGVDIYAKASDMVDDEDQAREFQDSVITLYNVRNEKYDNEARWIENKAYYAYRFFKGDKDRVGDAVELFDRVVEIHGKITTPQLVAAYFDAIYRHFAYNQAYTPEEALTKYEELMAMLEDAEEEGKDVATPKATLEQLLVAMDIIDCDFINNSLGPRLEKDPESMKLAKQIFEYSVQHKCTNTPAFLSALEVIDNADPTFTTSQVRGLRYMQNSEYDKAGELFEKALTLAETDEQKAEIHWDMAKVHANLNRKGQARSSALKAAEFNKEEFEKRAHGFVAGMYMSSSSDCRGGQSRVKDYSIYIAAYNAYAKAGDSDGMREAKSRFPSKEELFTEGYQVGDEINTGCWIGQTVTLATRD